MIERLASLAPGRKIDWSDSWSDEDLRDFRAASLRRLEASESEDMGLQPGDVVVGVLEGAVATKVRPAILISSTTYLAERPDVLVGILTTRPPKPAASTDYALEDSQTAGLRAESHFRAYVLTVHRSELTIIGHLSDRDWNKVRECVGNAFAK